MAALVYVYALFSSRNIGCERFPITMPSEVLTDSGVTAPIRLAPLRSSLNTTDGNSKYVDALTRIPSSLKTPNTMRARLPHCGSDEGNLIHASPNSHGVTSLLMWKTEVSRPIMSAICQANPARSSASSGSVAPITNTTKETSGRNALSFEAMRSPCSLVIVRGPMDFRSWDSSLTRARFASAAACSAFAARSFAAAVSFLSPSSSLSVMEFNSVDHFLWRNSITNSADTPIVTNALPINRMAWGISNERNPNTNSRMRPMATPAIAHNIKASNESSRCSRSVFVCAFIIPRRREGRYYWWAIPLLLAVEGLIVVTALLCRWLS